MLGLFLLVAFNLNRFIDALGRDVQVQIYLRESAGPQEIETLRRSLLADPAVAGARLVSGGEARRRFRQTFPALADLPDAIGGAVFPPSLEIALRDGQGGAETVERLARTYGSVPEVEEVRYDLGWIRRLADIVGLVRRGGYGLGGLLLLAVMVTVGAVVRLAVLTRREEIAIMKLVGATAGFIRGPFLLGASAQGLAGGGLAVAALALTHRTIERSVIFGQNPFLSMVVGRFLPPQALLLLIGGGAVLGFLAAALALRRAGTF